MSLIVIEGSNGSGKTEIVNRMTKKYDIIDKKSIPDWYRSEIEFARKCPFDIQKEIYLYGHKANYLECDKEQNYIFDRYAYSTIIRINYELGKPVEETINEMDSNINNDNNNKKNSNNMNSADISFGNSSEKKNYFTSEISSHIKKNYNKDFLKDQLDEELSDEDN